jgi:hypothetical protein
MSDKAEGELSGFKLVALGEMIQSGSYAAGQKQARKIAAEYLRVKAGEAFAAGHDDKAHMCRDAAVLLEQAHAEVMKRGRTGSEECESAAMLELQRRDEQE